MTDLRTTTIELRLDWTTHPDADGEFGICEHDHSEVIPVTAIWPEGPPDRFDATLVAEVLHVTAHVEVCVPNPAWVPGMDALPGMEAPLPFITTSVKL
jgi:hypothetical protein